MKTLIGLLVALVAITEAASDDEAVLRAWKTFKEQFKKTYENEIEEEIRKKIFMEKMHMITEHNSNYEKGLVSFKLGINEFSDISHEEMALNKNCFKIDKKLLRAKTFQPSRPTPDLPKEVDWVKAGAVTPVKSQGPCSACWAFAATGALEGQYFQEKHNLVPLSEQNLIDCTSNEEYGNDGCNSGSYNIGYDYVLNNGIESESSYPYRAKKHKRCFYDPKWNVTSITGEYFIPDGAENFLQEIVATRGPVATGFDHSLPSFDSYASGIYDEEKCSSTDLNHALLITGYGTENGKDYWVVKNCWGKGWGEEGYMRVARNKNRCGIATYASYPMI